MGSDSFPRTAQILSWLAGLLLVVLSVPPAQAPGDRGGSIAKGPACIHEVKKVAVDSFRGRVPIQSLIATKGNDAVAAAHGTQLSKQAR